MHFTASQTSMMMITELISSANYICTLYGVTVYLLTIHGEKDIPEVTKTQAIRDFPATHPISYFVHLTTPIYLSGVENPFFRHTRVKLSPFSSSRSLLAMPRKRESRPRWVGG